MVISCDVCISDGEAGITLYMDENHHYDLAIHKSDHGYEVIKRLNVGDIKSVEKSINLKTLNKVSLLIRADNYHYNFFIEMDGEEIQLGTAQTKYLSSEVAGRFTCVFIGLYAYGENYYTHTEFKNFKCQYI